MIKLNLLGLFLLLAFSINAQKKVNYFPENQLITTGVYYYPEHWDSLQWERDLKNIAAMGFEFTHFAEFAFVSTPRKGCYH